MRGLVGPLLIVFSGFIAAPYSTAQKQIVRLSRIVSAKTIYFKNQTGSDPVGNGALAELKKWGKFQIVADPKQVDLILLLSADPYHGREIIISGGQTGSIDSQGRITEDSVPNYGRISTTRYAYLTVVDPKTGENLWSAEHVWGGLITGFNSVGSRLVKALEKQTKK